ncbi:MAG: cation:proton antiporter [Acidimicrobiales bacterium]|nr:cation:proton antiporter [Acidimicrobiales bacterium]
MEGVAAIATIVALGVGSLWLASLLRIPSILILLLVGILIGPVTDQLDPDAVFGELLFPAISVGVGILLFEGGLTLRWDRLVVGRDVVVRIVTIGVLVTWVVGGLAAALILPGPAEIGWLIGSILVVSGPTVVLPLLRMTRPREPVGSVLRWEGIFNDPVGATLAIVVLDVVAAGLDVSDAAVRVLTTMGAGTAVGLAAAVLLVVVLERHLVPDHLHNAVTFMAIVGAFEIANLLRPEAGLFATTVLGLAIANQRRVAARHIVEFEESLVTLILGALFIVLGARVDLDAVWDYLPRSLALLAILVFVARPLAVLVSTIGSGLTWRQRAFIAWMAPRGIVAAAVASLFAIELHEEGIEADPIVPVVFTVILGTVALYGLTARVAARLTRVAGTQPHGIAIIGARQWLLETAEALADHDVPLLLIISDDDERTSAAMRGLLVYSGRLDSEELLETVHALGIGQVLAASAIDTLDGYGLERLAEAVGRANVYALPADEAEAAEAGVATSIISRRPFGRRVTHTTIDAVLDTGASVRVVEARDLARRPGLPLVVISGNAARIYVEGDDPDPNSTVVVLG